MGLYPPVSPNRSEGGSFYTAWVGSGHWDLGLLADLTILTRNAAPFGTLLTQPSHRSLSLDVEELPNNVICAVEPTSVGRKTFAAGH